MRSSGFAIIAAFAVTLGGSAAFAQNQQPKVDQPEEVREPPADAPQVQNPQARSGEEAANDMLGAWEFSDADHNRICHFNFRGEAASGGRRLDVDKNCPNLFPSTKDVVGWTIDNYGGLVEKGLARAAPAKWLEVVRRQMEPMFSRIEGILFKEYPVAGGWLTQELTKKREEFWAVIRELLQA